MDHFGLDRELKIVRSGVRDIFTPHQPIQSLELFFGRQKQVAALIEHLNTPGQHGLLFGDRGVGKSSLANIASELLLARFVSGKLFVKRCDSTDSFLTVVEKPLMEVGVDISLMSRSEGSKKEGGGKLGGGGIGANFGGSKSRENQYGSIRDQVSPSWVADKLISLNGLLLVDEVDALKYKKDRHQIAELIKQLSDSGSPFKLLLVGIADTGADLTAGHPSVYRCLKETPLKRMEDEELEGIVRRGEERLQLKFTVAAKKRIVSVSSGYAHFTHLLALKAAEDAIAEGRNEIGIQAVEKATRRAVDDAEGSLKRTYDAAIRSGKTDEYRKIICASTISGVDEFTAANLRDSYKKLWGHEIKQSVLNNYLVRLVSNDGSAVLRRLAKGVYRFSDPRMPSFVRIANPDILSA